MREPYPEERLREAWLSAEAAPGGGCPPVERFWDAVLGSLSARDVERLLDHAAGCGACTQALATAQSIHAASGLPELGPVRESVWSLLGRSVLRPQAALAYLVLLALSWPLYRATHPEAPPPPGPAPAVRVESAPAAQPLAPARVVALEPARRARGAGVNTPLSIATRAGESLVLRVFLDPDDLDPAAALRVTIADGARTIAEQERTRDAVGESATLDLAVDASALPHGTPLTLVVRSKDAVVFERTLVLESP